MRHFVKRSITALVGVIVAVAWAGAATAVHRPRRTSTSLTAPTTGRRSSPDGLALSPVIDIFEDFDGTSFPAGREQTEWNPGGGATVGDGVLTVEGARANTTALYGSDRSLDFLATFSGAPFQHVGFGQTFGRSGAVGHVQHGRDRKSVVRSHECWRSLGRHAHPRRCRDGGTRIQHRVDPHRDSVLRGRRAGADTCGRDQCADAPDRE